MSRVGKQPISIPKGVDITIAGKQVTVKGSKGSLTLNTRAARFSTLGNVWDYACFVE